MNIWGAVFSLLFIAYAFCLRKTIFKKGVWQHVAVWLIAIYGAGEGVGSGLFPYNQVSDHLTMANKLHLIFSGLGDAALVILPFVVFKIFPKRIYPGLHTCAGIVAFSGPVLIIFFLLARASILPWRGLWQRLYLLDYYLLLIAISIKMLADHFTAHRQNDPARSSTALK
jgi:hypothetical protein